MDNEKKSISVSQFSSIVEILNPSMDDFLYIYDLQNDYYYISPGAVERFCMDSNEFYDVSGNHKKFVHPDDFDMLAAELDKIVEGELTAHNMWYRWIDKEGKAVWINCRGQVTLDESGKPQFLVGCINEIGKTQAADNISGLLGEKGLRQEIEKHADSKKSGFIMRLGIDDFRAINENRGFDYGDMILHKTVECIQSVLAPEQKLYRIVADEFAIVDFTGKSEALAHNLYCDIRWAINRFIEENEYEVFYTLSAGILRLDDLVNQEYDNLNKLSEFSLAEAKKRGKNQSYIYNSTDYAGFQRRRKLGRAMRQSVNNGFQGFDTHFQPIMNIGDGKLTMAETLLRFQTEEIGSVSPIEFIPLLEESSLIIPVGRWVLHKAMEACKYIQRYVPNFCVTVNLSYVQIQKSNILSDILEGLEEYDLSPASIAVELTESGFLESDECFIRFCSGLQEAGIRLALDDFGTGYSNFHYLYDMSPDTIKIDRSFTVKALENDYEYGLLKQMVEMVHGINLKMCIEGIETEEELKKISKMGPDYIQGYFFGRPCAFDTFLAKHIT
ncbi:MAG: EAL domain-containing protein [Lachnospiraceae bacterium]|nr:EAL domain-containing protein [Lachnospiraceae bacterium]